ncbi:MAG: AmmeMemoRadiSam system radical SAM enzyme [Oscillospiraceae bacterium]|nr:AmmeMemoRadiSam system radical SAM enzyme [Oscillospiraceae bacterium]
MNDSHEALFWHTEANGAARCGLCPRECLIQHDAKGFCGVRENRHGSLIAAGYGVVSSIALDPIEKKPLYMFCPGSRILSLGGFGCNLRCPFCQNYEISIEYGDPARAGKAITPDEVTRLAVEAIPEGNTGVAFTYNEPLIGYEFVHDCARLVHEVGLYNVLVTNGFINREPLEAILPLIDAVNIDLKGFTSRFYAGLGDGRALETVKGSIELCANRCHVEVTTLVIPGENEDDVGELSRWLSSVDPSIPLHLTRFFPRYRYADKQATQAERLFKLREEALRHLENVFVGNV